MIPGAAAAAECRLLVWLGWSVGAFATLLVIALVVEGRKSPKGGMTGKFLSFPDGPEIDDKDVIRTRESDGRWWRV